MPELTYIDARELISNYYRSLFIKPEDRAKYTFYAWSSLLQYIDCLVDLVIFAFNAGVISAHADQ